MLSSPSEYATNISSSTVPKPFPRMVILPPVVGRGDSDKIVCCILILDIDGIVYCILLLLLLFIDERS
jgi:hypothetical protein